MRPVASRALLIAAVIAIITLAAAWWAWTVLASYQAAVDADHRATQAATGTIAEVSVDGGLQFRVSWKDRDGREHTDLFRQAPGHVIDVGDPFAVRYDPGHPDTVFAQDDSAVQHTRDEVFKTSIVVLLVGVPALLAWYVRLIRWMLGTRSEVGSARLTLRPIPETVLRGVQSARCWLELRDANDQVRYQLPVWEPSLTVLGSRQHEVTIRTCLGDAYIVDVPGHGRLWPAGAALSDAPTSLPSPGQRGELGNTQPGSTVMLYVIWPILGAGAGGGAGGGGGGGVFTLSVIGGLYVLVMVLAIWHWSGLAAPGQSVSPLLA